MMLPRFLSTSSRLLGSRCTPGLVFLLLVQIFLLVLAILDLLRSLTHSQILLDIVLREHVLLVFDLGEFLVAAFLPFVQSDLAFRSSPHASDRNAIALLLT